MKPALSALAGTLLVLASMSSPAQDVPVVDRSNAPTVTGGAGREAVNAVTTPVATTRMPAVAPAPTNQLAELLMTLDQLQEEVRFLRGQVEEQAHALKKMQTDQRDRYRDLDRRISLLTQRAVASPPQGNSGAVTPALPITAPEAPPVTPAPISNAPRVTDQQAYTQAFGLVRQRAFDDALKAFADFRRDYPQSKLLPNVLYWTGEVLRAKPVPDLVQAEQYYREVVERFPEHQKAGDATYKLGLTYDGLGDGSRAQEMMNRVVSLFPDQPSAALAREYLSKH